MQLQFIPFKIGSLWSNTEIPALLPLFIAVQEVYYTRRLVLLTQFHFFTMWSYLISKHPLLHVAHKTNFKSTTGCTNNLSTFSVTDTVIKSA
jgi:hypothetical protein